MTTSGPETGFMRPFETKRQLMLPTGRPKSSLRIVNLGMMPAAFGPVIPATSRVTVMLVYAEETPSDFARKAPEGTRYVVNCEKCGRNPRISWHL